MQRKKTKVSCLSLVIEANGLMMRLWSLKSVLQGRNQRMMVVMVMKKTEF